MITFKEENDSLYLYKEGKQLSEIAYPTFLWNTAINQILQVGDKEHVVTYYRTAVEVCKKHQMPLFMDWVMVELPKDAELLNHILQFPEELKKYRGASQTATEHIA